MGRGPQDRQGEWLSPDAYDALSPKEKRDLWARRQIERKYNRRRKRHGRQRENPLAATLGGLALFGVLVAGVVAWQSKPMSWLSSPALTASGQKAVTASFRLCHVGGGTNCVVDGDTIWLEGQNIRIADIDAPETHEFGCPEEKARGDRATLRLQELVNSGPISLSSVDRDQDVYGRKLRLVYVNGKSVGDTLVGEGLARYYRGGKRSWC